MNPTIDELREMIGYLKMAAVTQPNHAEMFNKIAATLQRILNTRIILAAE